MPNQFAIYDSVALLPPRLQGRPRDWYNYPADYVGIAASATQSQDVKISDDADFILVLQMATVSNAAQTTFFTPAPFTVSIKDAGAGRDLVSAPVHLNNLFGTAQMPFVLPQPKLLFRASTYTVTITNLDAAAAYTVRLGFSGYKVYGDRLADSY